MNKKLITSLVAGLGLVATAPAVLADAQLEVYDLTTGTTLYTSPYWSGANGGIGQNFSYTGNGVSFSGTVNWNSTGNGQFLDLGDFSSTSANSDELVVTIEANGYTMPGGGATLTTTGTGGIGDTIGYYWDPLNTVLSGNTIQQLYSVTVTSTPFALVNTAAFDPNNKAFSLGIGLAIPAGGATKISTDDSIDPVPDGGNVAILLGSAMIGLSCLRARFSRKA